MKYMNYNIFKVENIKNFNKSKKNNNKINQTFFRRTWMFVSQFLVHVVLIIFKFVLFVYFSSCFTKTGCHYTLALGSLILIYNVLNLLEEKLLPTCMFTF